MYIPLAEGLRCHVCIKSRILPGLLRFTAAREESGRSCWRRGWRVKQHPRHLGSWARLPAARGHKATLAMAAIAQHNAGSPRRGAEVVVFHLRHVTTIVTHPLFYCPPSGTTASIRHQYRTTHTEAESPPARVELGPLRPCEEHSSSSRSARARQSQPPSQHNTG